MKELLFSITKKDLAIDYFSGTGPGGQNRNKVKNSVRIHHKESGTLVTGQSNRDRIANLREAFNNLIKHPKFKLWHNLKIQEILEGKSIEQKVDEMLEPENLKIEYRIDDKWVENNG